MARRKESRYVFTPGISGAGTIKLPGKIDLSDILSIINVTSNITIFSLGEQGKGGSVSYSTPELGTDVDFPYAQDGITTITLTLNTSTMSSSDKLLILIEEELRGLSVRPHFFGGDAMERVRTASPQTLLEADFEYGTQLTKWQHLSLNQNYPTFADSSLAFFTITSINAAAAVNGFSVVTITTSTANPPNFPAAGDSIYVSGTTNNFANGVFIVASVSGGNTITYQSKGSITAGSILTGDTRVRRGVTITGSQLPCTFASDGAANSTITATFSAGNNHNLVPGSPIVVFDTAAGNLFHESNWFLPTVPNGGTFSYTATGLVTAGALPNTSAYSKPDSYSLHRPFDGGVILGSYYPIYGLKTIRQTKRTFKYQSGKSMFFSTGAKLTPTLQINSITASGVNLGDIITVTTTPFHGLQDTSSVTGATVVIEGVTTSGYNGTYEVASVTGDTTFTILAQGTLGSATPALSDNPIATVKNWHGACVRTGMFDDMNGLFWEYDGQDLYAVKRSSTFQLAGSLALTTNSQSVGGTNTRFTQQLRVGDFIVIRGQPYQVSSITNDTTMSISPEFRGATSTSGVLYSKVVDTRVKQSQFNGDKLNGTGPSGYNLDLTKMQMMGIQFTWYGAGFIDFMLRGPDGEYILAHRINNNNKNSEAYMRSGNLPARYETYTASNSTPYLTVASGTGSAGLTVSDVSYYPPSGAVLLVSNQAGVISKEVVLYTGKSATQLTGLIRAATYNSFIAGSNRPFTGDTVARNHPIGTTVQLLTVTCAPQISHWGSAVVMDGGYDEDTSNRFVFNRSQVALAASGTIVPIGFRPSPTVSDDVPGIIGQRDVINRSFTQLLELQVRSVSANAAFEIIGLLNPIATTPASPTWTSLSSIQLGGATNLYYQPTFAQGTTSITAAPAGAEVLFCFNGGTGDNRFDLSGIRELQNSIVGGDGIYPNGPDTLLIVIRNLIATAATVDVSLRWKEAQA